MTWPNALRHPVVLIGLVLAALTLHALAVGSHLSIVTEIVIYVLYGAGLNVMLGYTGLVPFGASVFFVADFVAARSSAPSNVTLSDEATAAAISS